MSVSASLPSTRRSDAWRIYFRPKVVTMLLLGFSSGLPFMLVGNTLAYWLRDAGITLTTIGFLSWVGLAYSLKPLWAPLVDRADAPMFGRLGRRRGWMMAAQFAVGLGLLAMALIGPSGGLVALAASALIAAFASSTQDIVIDAWRIEIARDGNELGLLSSVATLGYRAALLVTDALILVAANHLGWPLSYAIMAALMGVGVFATLRADEPKQADSVMEAKGKELPLWTWRGFADAVIGPFVAFFQTNKWLGLLMLAVISLYQIPNYVSGPMANTFYVDVGLSKDAVGGIRASVGLGASLLGIAAGGISAVRFGYMRTLVIGLLLEALAVLAYIPIAYSKGDLTIFAAMMALDSFGLAFAGVALMTYMSSLTSLGYTATQYALLSSAYSYLGKILKGFSGEVVDALHVGRNLMDAYALFFAGSAAIALPGVILCLFLAQAQKKPSRTSPDNSLQPF
jgi:PAT family beta-lactamase induction signal transducer AmpG